MRLRKVSWITFAFFAAIVIVIASLGLVYAIGNQGLTSNGQNVISSTIIPKGSAPKIQSVGSSVNPSVKSQTVQLSATVTWGGTSDVFCMYVNNSLIYSWSNINGPGPGPSLSPTSSTESSSLSSTFTTNYAFNSTGNVEVKVIAGDSGGSTTETYSQEVVNGPLPTINSVNSSSNPAYVGEKVSFNSAINWYGYSGRVAYSMNNTPIKGSSYTFNKSGNYNVTAKAISYDGSNATKTFVQEVNPFNILNVNLMNNETSFNRTSPYNNSKISVASNVQYNSSLASLTNYTIENGSYSLIIYNGTYNGDPAIILFFTMTTSSWNSSISYTLLLNKTTNHYSGILSADISPVVNQIHLGNGIVINYTSTLGSQLIGIENGIQLLTSNYTHSNNTTLATLGAYYANLGVAFSTFSGMVPENISSLHVTGTQAQITDLSWWCYLEIGLLVADIGMVILDIIGFIIAPEVAPLEAWLFFLEVNFSIPADIAGVILDC
ncbi:MAG: hypothetical protein AAE983_05500 [Thermoplasmataceae archaeon]|jgi:hypothetical protein